MPPTFSYPSANRRKYADFRATTPTRPSPLRYASTIPTTPDDDEPPALQPPKASSTIPVTPSPTNRRASAQLSQKRRISLGELQQAPNSKQTTPASASFKQDSTTKDPMSIGISKTEFRDVPSPKHNSHLTNSAEKASPGSPLLDTADFEKLGRSATKELRTLSKLAEQRGKEELTISGIQRNLSKKGSKSDAAPGYGGRTSMDKERQYRQAYEYLCHIGEAKEWIEHVIDKPISAIVQLEESLRDGVTLAEVVQAFHPEKRLRIFRHAKLQFRHSDNIVLFFQFLAEVELPELFRFELVDLYEKKNIPKVIYCIHALSWVLLGKNIVDFRMGNLVGRLKFENHELELKQKELDRAGVSMPNFAGMGERFGAEPVAIPEPDLEPIETEEDRIARELIEHENGMVDFQAQLCGAMVRLRLGNVIYDLYQEENKIVHLQATIRAIMVRQTFSYQLQRHQFAINLQSRVRGFTVRSHRNTERVYWRDHEHSVILIQSLVRARSARKEVQNRRATLQHHWTSHTPQIIRLQSYVRRRYARKRVEALKAEMRQFWDDHKNDVVTIQSLVRKRKAMKTKLSLEAERKKFWMKHEHEVVTVQNLVRRRMARQRLSQLKTDREAYYNARLQKVVVAQSAVRRRAVLQSTSSLKHTVQQYQGDFIELQSAIRGTLMRRHICDQLDDLEEVDAVVTKLQACIRGRLLRQRHYLERQAILVHEGAIIDLQSQIRALLARNTVGDQLETLLDGDDEATVLQAAIRGMLLRRKYDQKLQHYQENIKKVIKLQSFARMKQQGQAYKSLTTGKNPPVATIKSFVHLLNDSDFDFDQELESEKVQQTVVQQIKKVEEVEDYIAEVDVKIGLLAHTKIHSDEIAKLKRQVHAHSVGLSRKSTSVRDPATASSLNRESRAKVERYQELFFILQTQPQYLTRLFGRVRENGSSEADCKKLESLVMSTFGFAQKSRDEFYLLRLLCRSMTEEIRGCDALQDFVRGNFLYSRVFSVYARMPRDRKFIQRVLRPTIKNEIVDNETLDLESDPLQIYRALIDDDYLRSGSTARNPNLLREEAIRQDDVRRMFVSHLQDVRDLVDHFLASIKEKAPHMPYGTRYMAQQMFESLYSRFPRENPRIVLQVVGYWIYKTYFKPALTDPEGFGLIDVGLDNIQRRNLATLSKVLHQTASGKSFDHDDIYMQPLNRYLEDFAIPELESVWQSVIEIESIDAKFEIGQFDDFYAKVKPTLFIKTADITAMHKLIVAELASLCLGPEDEALREVVRVLGSPSMNETEMHTGPTEITLTLGGRMHAIEDQGAKLKALLVETKRCILYIIRVQTGANLLDVMVKPITQEDRDRWDAIVREELALSNRKQNAYADTTTNLIDIASLPYEELKRTALENILVLEQQGRLNRYNHYQDILNEIALDIRTKHRRRLQRQKELETARGTSKHLEDKLQYLQDTLSTYNDTFEQSVRHLQEKSKDAKRFVLPLSKQWRHQQELAKTGKAPKFGSWRRSGDVMVGKGVVLGWDGHDLRQHDLTISSDKVNEFVLEGSRGTMMIPGAVATFTWDDLLTAEYEGKDVLEFFAKEGTGGGSRSFGMRGGSTDDARSVQGVRGGVGYGSEAGVLRVNRRGLMLWLSKKFLGSV